MPNPYCQPIGIHGTGIFTYIYIHVPYKSTIHVGIYQFHGSLQNEGISTLLSLGELTSPMVNLRIKATNLETEVGSALQLGKTTSKLISTAFQKNAIDLQNLRFFFMRV